MDLCLALDQLDTSAIRGVEHSSISEIAATVVAQLIDEEALLKLGQKPFNEGRPPKEGKGHAARESPRPIFLLGDRPHPRDSRDDPAGISSGRIRTHPVRTDLSSENYAETINRFPFTKSFLADSWKLKTTWETFWPPGAHEGLCDDCPDPCPGLEVDVPESSARLVARSLH